MTAHSKILTADQYEQRSVQLADDLKRAEVALDKIALANALEEPGASDKLLAEARSSVEHIKVKISSLGAARSESKRFEEEAAAAATQAKLKSGSSAVRKQAAEQTDAFAALVVGIDDLGKAVNRYRAARDAGNNAAVSFQGMISPQDVRTLRDAFNDTRRERDILNAALYETGLWELFGIGEKDAWLRGREVDVATFLQQRRAGIEATLEQIIQLPQLSAEQEA
jgi:hypothetical protein